MEELSEELSQVKTYRKMAKVILKHDYKTQIKPYINIVKLVMKANNIEAIPALLKIKDTELYTQKSTTKLLFGAAVADILDEGKDENLTRPKI